MNTETLRSDVIMLAGKAIAGLAKAGLAKIIKPVEGVAQSSEDVEALQRAEARRIRRRVKLQLKLQSNGGRL